MYSHHPRGDHCMILGMVEGTSQGGMVLGDISFSPDMAAFLVVS